jgi:signal transduction histidine kinase
MGWVPLGDVVHDAVEAMDIDARVAITISDLPAVFGDADALELLFRNLIENATKFVSHIEPAISISSQEDNSSWTISVSDNGIGIAPESREEVFLPFRRLHDPSEYEGAGLGLATCRRIAHQHNGRIWVESEPSAGSTFHVKLPKPVGSD